MTDIEARITPSKVSFAGMKTSFDCGEVFENEEELRDDIQEDSVEFNLDLEDTEEENELKCDLRVKRPNIKVDENIKEFLAVSDEELEDRMDVDLWIDKVANMNQVEIKECSYDMRKLLGK